MENIEENSGITLEEVEEAEIKEESETEEKED